MAENRSIKVGSEPSFNYYCTSIIAVGFPQYILLGTIRAFAAVLKIPHFPVSSQQLHCLLSLKHYVTY